jgi:mannose-6-phosphate isomerase-like protein (cupin superfamily)
MAKKSHLGSAELGLEQPVPVHDNSENMKSARSDTGLQNPNSEKGGSHPDSHLSGSAPPASVSRDVAEHYRWGVDCDGWHLVKDKQLSVIEEFMPPGAAEIRHHHERSQQFFYILTGEVLIEINGENMLVPAGSGVRIMPGMRHQIRNPSSSPVRFLVISQPASHDDRIDD